MHPLPGRRGKASVTLTRENANCSVLVPMVTFHVFLSPIQKFQNAAQPFRIGCGYLGQRRRLKTNWNLCSLACSLGH